MGTLSFQLMLCFSCAQFPDKFAVNQISTNYYWAVGCLGSWESSRNLTQGYGMESKFGCDDTAEKWNTHTEMLQGKKAV